MPYDSGSGNYIRRATTVLDETPDGDTVNSAVATKLDTSTDDAVTDLNHHNVNGGHYPATSVNTESRYLKQSPAGQVSWASGVPIDQAALKDLSNVTAGVTANINISGNAATATSATSATSATTAASCSGNAATATDLATGSVLAIAKGGTGASDAAGARANLGILSPNVGKYTTSLRSAATPQPLAANTFTDVNRQAAPIIAGDLGATDPGTGVLALRVPESGTYQVRVWFTVTTTSSGGLLAGIARNGTPAWQGGYALVNSSAAVQPMLITVAELSANDVIGVRAYSSVAATIAANEAGIEILRVR